MKDIVKKSFLLGLGAASITKAKAEKIVRALLKKGGISAKEGKQMIKRVIGEANKTKKLKSKMGSLEKRVRERGKKTARELLKQVSK